METALLSMAQEFSGLPMDSLIGGPLNAAANANAAMALTQTKFMLNTCFVKTTIPGKKKIDAKPAEVDATGKVIKPEIVGTPEIPEHDEYAPILIQMSLTKGVITPGEPAQVDSTGKVIQPATATEIKKVNTNFTLPLLTIIPINSLAVETVDINFEMEVKSSFSEDTSEAKEKNLQAAASLDVKLGWGPISASIKGSVSYDQKDSSTHDTHYQKSNSAKYTVGVHAGQLPLPKGVNIIIEAFSKSIQPITLN